MSKGRPKKSASALAKPAKSAKSSGKGANLGFEAQLFLAADKLRKNLEPSDYKHVCLPPLPRTRTSTSLKTCFGYRKRPAGRTCKPAPSSRPSVS